MPETKYINFKIGGKQVDLLPTADLPVAIDYELENQDDFQQKKAAQALEISLPATVDNSSVFESFYNPNVEGNSVKDAKDCLIEAAGVQLFKGKAIIESATKQFGKPKSFMVNCYGSNGDWMLPLQDKTLHDFLSSHTHTLNQATVFNTWYNFDGMSEDLDYFYCPVRYAKPFTDTIARVLDLRPSISIYWIIWRAFQSLGYKIQSYFMDSAYFRGLVMPWTWGDFLLMDSSKLDVLKFKATGIPASFDTDNNGYYEISPNGDATTIVGTGISGGDVVINNTYEMSCDYAPLGYDNGNNYSYNTSSGVMRYVFNHTPADLLGVSDITFHLTINTRMVKHSLVGSAGQFRLYIDWTISGGGSGTIEIADSVTQSFTGLDGVIPQYIDVDIPLYSVVPGSTIDFVLFFKREGHSDYNAAQGAVYSRKYDTDPTGGNQLFEAYFETSKFSKTIGSIVDFKLYDEFKNYNFLDLLRGVIDAFDLSIQTDSLNKIVRIEPTYPYYKGLNPNDKTNGYFQGTKIDWTSKMDISKESTLELFSDIEQEFNMLFKDDGNDGGAKIYGDRNGITAAASKYLFTDRFKTGKVDNENRFFSPVMHVKMDEWKQLSEDQVSPQLIALIPENISNTSASTSEYNFSPKMAFARRVDLSNPDFKNGKIYFEDAAYACPEMFAVNYNKGGENDPVLTYCDQNIESPTVATGVVAHGLMRRFFLQRISIMRNGKRLKAWYNLTSGDITNFFHREPIVQDNAIYHLFNIYGYQPLASESTQCQLWKWSPITQVDSDNCFPSLSSVLNGVLLSGGKDTTYSRLLLLASDIPQ